jgi:glycerophosphoryl diester phosphodiesterase family protein
MDTTVWRWAHQGGAREGPTNTLAAMTRAMDGSGGRANALEFDVHRTKDGAVVVIHDRTLERTTNGKGKVRRRTLEDLRRLDAAYWWVPGQIVDHHAADDTAYEHRHIAPGDRLYGIPTIDEVLDRFPDVPLTIEVKAWGAARPLIDRLAERDRRDVTVTALRDHIVWRARRRARKHPEWETTFAPGLLYSLWFLARTRFGRPPRSARYGRIQVPRRKLIFDFTPAELRRRRPPRRHADRLLDDRRPRRDAGAAGPRRRRDHDGHPLGPRRRDQDRRWRATVKTPVRRVPAAEQPFDVFLSHNSADKPAARPAGQDDALHFLSQVMMPVWSLIGRHQASFSRYQRIVAPTPSSKETLGSQPSSRCRSGRQSHEE